MSDLLVSVRNVAEAMIALDGGAAIIDVKEPSRGPLGRADDETIAEIVRAVKDRRPVSAAMGEWAAQPTAIPSVGLTYIKWGLARCQGEPTWRDALQPTPSPAPQRVLVAYADWQCASAPSVDEVFEVAAHNPGSVMLVDTHCKDANNVIRKAKPTLLDWLPQAWIVEFCDRCRRAGVKIALAGSLGPAEIAELLPARPDWFAVRGAVCDDSDRHAEVRLEKVAALVKLLQSAG